MQHAKYLAQAYEPKPRLVPPQHSRRQSKNKQRPVLYQVRRDFFGHVRVFQDLLGLGLVRRVGLELLALVLQVLFFLVVLFVGVLALIVGPD